MYIQYNTVFIIPQTIKIAISMANLCACQERMAEEIPHAIYVTVEDIEHNEETNTIWVRAAIIVERETQKGIVVGKGGANITKIRKGCTPEIRAIFPGKKLQLDLRVKAQDKWRNNASVLDRILR